jgi:hypothetical protein
MVRKGLTLCIKNELITLTFILRFSKKIHRRNGEVVELVRELLRTKVKIEREGAVEENLSPPARGDYVWGRSAEMVEPRGVRGRWFDWLVRLKDKLHGQSKEMHLCPPRVPWIIALARMKKKYKMWPESWT